MATKVLGSCPEIGLSTLFGVCPAPSNGFLSFLQAIKRQAASNIVNLSFPIIFYRIKIENRRERDLRCELLV